MNSSRFVRYRVAFTLLGFLLLTGCAGPASGLSTDSPAVPTGTSTSSPASTNTSTSTSPPTPTLAPADQSAVCAVAAELTRAGKPDQALETIKKLRELGPIKPPSSETAKSSAPSETTPPPTPISTSTDVVPSAAPTPAIQPTACQQELVDALRASGIAQKPLQTRVDKLQNPPGAWLPNWTAPFTSAAPVFAGMLLATTLLARFFATTARCSKTLLGLRPGLARAAVCGVGIVLAVAGSYFFVAKLTELLDPFSAPLDGSNGSQPAVFSMGLLLAFWLATAAAGSMMFAYFLASRLRVSVVIRDKAGKVDDAAVDKAVAYMTELGGSPPRGMQVPRGADVTALSGDVLVDAPTNKILAALKKIVQSALLFVPWNVTIDETVDDQISVVVARNGWVNNAATFSTKSLGLPDSEAAPPKGGEVSTAVSPPGDRRQKVAAAVVIATLATKHRGFEGLCGATHWRSIGLHYIATTELDQQPDEAVALLAQALNADPFNLPAQLASQYYRYKKSDTEAELLTFTNWLRARIDDFPRPNDRVHDGHEDTYSRRLLNYLLSRTNDRVHEGHKVTFRRRLLNYLFPFTNGRVHDGHEGIYRRLLLNYVLAMLNLHSVLKSAGKELTDDQKKETLDSAKVLTDSLAKRIPETDVMSQAMRQVAAIAQQAVQEIISSPAAGSPPKPPEHWMKVENSPLAPNIAYNLACYLASHTSPAAEPNPVQRPLTVACEDDRLRSWAKEDPVLADFRGQDWFQKLVGASPRTTFLEIEPFKEHKTKIEAIGATKPTRLLAVSPWRLKEYLDVHSLRVDRLRRLAQLAQKVEEPAGFPMVQKYRVELLELLVSDGVEDVKDIQNDAAHRTDLITKLKTRCLVQMPEKELREWLDTLKQ